MNNRIITSLDEIYFNTSIERTFSMGDDKSPLKLSQCSEKINIAYEYYKNPQYQMGFSTKKELDYYNIIECYYYNKGGYAILPSYLTLDKSNQYNEEPNSFFDAWHQDYNEKIKWDKYKRLMEISFLHILPTGEILEFFIGNNQTYDYNTAPKSMFDIIEQARLKYILEENLKIKNNDISRKKKI